jgi:lysozyme
MSVRKTTITVASAAAIALAVPAVKAYEGLWLTVKTDWVGTGHPATGGYGETENVRLGETHDEKYWAGRLAQRLPEYDRKIGACIHVELPDSARASLISAAYNAGPAAVCKSPMVAKMNAGNVRAGCEDFLTSKIVNGERVYTGWYIRASGRVVKGLINRRANERKLCLSYLAAPKAPAPAPKKAWWRK